MAKRKRRARRDPSPPSRSPAALGKTVRAALAHEAVAVPSGDKLKLSLTVYLSREQAERLTARAIREGKNLEALVAEILEAAEGPEGTATATSGPRADPIAGA